MAIKWISVSVRVPHDRRDVLVWGEERYIGLGSQPIPTTGLTGKYLGKSRFNNRADGNGAFDIEVNKSWFNLSKRYVTHWSEITSPYLYDRIPKDGIEIIAAERRRQIDEEKWSAENDDKHINGSLATAAACYAIPESIREFKHMGTKSQCPRLWPWDSEWWKPCPNNRIRELAKAGALIAAEIDRKLRHLSP